MTSNLTKQTTTSANPDDTMMESITSASNTSPSAIDDYECVRSSPDASHHSSVSPPPSNTSKKKRNQNDLELISIEKEKLRLIEQQIRTAETHDDNYHFVMSLLPTMRKLSSDAQLRARIKMQQILLDELSTANNLRSFYSSFDNGNAELHNSQTGDTNYSQLS